MKIIIHKGAEEIGGNCIEISEGSTKILIDFGSPLSSNSKNISIDTSDYDAVIISHPHLDHYGMLSESFGECRLFCSELTHLLINTTNLFSNKDILNAEVKFFRPNHSFQVNNLKITPFLVDHSSADSFAFLIESNHCRVFYTGDFRATGRKKTLFSNMLNDPRLKNIDIMLIEGTAMNRSSSDFLSESDIESFFYKLFSKQTSSSFLIASSQNIDRIVTLYRACLKADKVLLIDFYTAWILKLMQKVSKSVPYINWKNIAVVHNFGGRYYNIIKEHEYFFEGFLSEVFSNNHLRIEELRDQPSKYVFKVSSSHIAKIADLMNIADPMLVYSQWEGYIKDDVTLKSLKNKYDMEYCHTSGHASVDDIELFLNTLQPVKAIPIHTETPYLFKKIYDKTVIYKDNEEILHEPNI